LVIVLVTISFAGPGATAERLVISGCVAEVPINPKIEIKVGAPSHIPPVDPARLPFSSVEQAPTRTGL
jgi:hypothetical protein